MGEAGLQDLPADRVERHRVGSLAQPDGPGIVIDVVHSQTADLQAGDSVDQAEDAEQSRQPIRSGSVRGPRT
ncbi:MAG: hypothetical protein JWP48_6997 [Actinoallomurus sp.]|nr:hypothetical protein [Actinoallomurus sp.]